MSKLFFYCKKYYQLIDYLTLQFLTLVKDVKINQIIDSAVHSYFKKIYNSIIFTTFFREKVFSPVTADFNSNNMQAYLLIVQHFEKVYLTL